MDCCNFEESLCTYKSQANCNVKLLSHRDQERQLLSKYKGFIKLI